MLMIAMHAVYARMRMVVVCCFADNFSLAGESLGSQAVRSQRLWTVAFAFAPIALVLLLK